MILIVQIIGKILFWFGLGIILKTKLATGYLGQKGIKLSNYVDSLTFIELFSILFTIFYLFSLFSQILLLNLSLSTFEVIEYFCLALEGRD